jgi:hypothetical protein
MYSRRSASADTKAASFAPSSIMRSIIIIFFSEGSFMENSVHPKTARQEIDFTALTGLLVQGKRMSRKPTFSATWVAFEVAKAFVSVERFTTNPIAIGSRKGWRVTASRSH